MCSIITPMATKGIAIAAGRYDLSTLSPTRLPTQSHHTTSVSGATKRHQGHAARAALPCGGSAEVCWSYWAVRLRVNTADEDDAGGAG